MLEIKKPTAIIDKEQTLKNIEYFVEKAISWLTNITPTAMGVGTAGLFIITGINLIMELYFFFLASLWLVLVGITVKKTKD